jgi:hypothetical protein
MADMTETLTLLARVMERCAKLQAKIQAKK